MIDGSKIDRVVLVVDDDEATRILIKEILEDQDVEILEAANMDEAISQFRDFRYQIVLILLDIHLYGFSGWELLAKIRQEDQLVPVVMVSAMVPVEEGERSRFGCNGFIAKPFDIEEFLATAMHYVNLKSC